LDATIVSTAAIAAVAATAITTVVSIAVPAVIAPHSTLLLSVPALTVAVTATATVPATLAIPIGTNGSSRYIH
jgi:hypothetical protein